MAYAAKVLLDSVSPAGVRLTTMEVTFPRFVLSEFNTHRVFSRNSASSRAIPTSKLIERVESDPVFPLEWGRNKAGMSASEMLADAEVDGGKRIWLDARDAAVAQARRLMDLKVHKQVLNRILEPFLWHVGIEKTSECDNYFRLRCAPNAQPDIREAALRMREALEASTPHAVAMGAWHLPLIQDDERALDAELLKQLSAARCARVSYMTHEGSRDPAKDLELYERLRSDRHLSPFEHVATPLPQATFDANFRGWRQFRAEIE